MIGGLARGSVLQETTVTGTAAAYAGEIPEAELTGGLLEVPGLAGTGRTKGSAVSPTRRGAHGGPVAVFDE
jgi:hypothetical protein